MSKLKSFNLDTQEVSRLKRRYLIWLYKTIKESLDRIDRKFTQLDIDRKIYEQLKKIDVLEDRQNWNKLLVDFSDYIVKKEREALSLKFIDSKRKLKADYLFLKSKLNVVEKIISAQFGKKELRRIKSLYEDEFVKRILEEREYR